MDDQTAQTVFERQESGGGEARLQTDSNVSNVKQWVTEVLFGQQQTVTDGSYQ